ncbi:MAG: CBS domain-containing protein [Planctomycetota bacterium]|nr:CBS domain-containing protein [Planctomycetota bacterium]MDA1136947.1 CBS domain-containing protein [Planctomycetota bacterium]
MTQNNDTASELTYRFLEAHPEDAARVLENLDATVVAEYLGGAPVKAAGEVLRRLTGAFASKVLENMQPDHAALALSQIPLDASAGLIRRLQEQTRKAVLNAFAKEDNEPLRSLLRYSKDSAGALMDPLVLALPHDLTVVASLEQIRNSPKHTTSYLYVVDREQKLIGVLNVRELMLADPAALLSSIMRPNMRSLSAHAPRAAILNHPAWKRFHTMPVVDNGGVFLGAVRYETLRNLEENSGTQAISDGAGAALGELYWVGLTGLVEGLAASITKRNLDL